jgi:succinyl-CoA synthetase alpha subunit
MSILVGKETRVVFQGITGESGSLHARACLAYGTKIVAGVTPGKGGMKFEDKVPVFDTVEQAVKNEARRCRASSCRPSARPTRSWRPRTAGCRLVVCITDGVPVLDMVQACAATSRARPTKLIGPNCPGIITPGSGPSCKIGIMPGHIHKKGKVGVLSKSGTLTYEAVGQLTALGIGQSSCIGIGGDPVGGLDFVDCLQLFNDDPETEGVVLIGEIGGSAEQRAAAWIKANMKKPVCAFIAGRTAPPGKRMGHAGAIIAGGKGTAAEKIEAFEAAGVKVSPTPAEMGTTMKSILG